MAKQFAHNPETGQVYVRQPGKGWVEIDPSTIDAAQESGGWATLAQAGQTAGGIVGGALELGERATNAMGLTDSTTFADVNDWTARQQATRDIVNPGASNVGTVAGFAPDLYAAVMSGGTSLPAQMARAGAVEGTLGALRNPDDPLTGAAIQGGLGAGGVAAGPVIAAGGALASRTAAPVVNSVRSAFGMMPANPMASAGTRRGVDMASEASRASGLDATLAEGKGTLSAARTAKDATPYEGQRILSHTLQPEQLDELGIPLTNADRAMLTAREGQDDIYKSAQDLRYTDEVRSSAGTGSVGGLIESAKKVTGRGVNDIRDRQKMALTRRTATMLGNPNISSLNPDNMIGIMDDLGSQFDDILGSQNGPLRAIDPEGGVSLPGVVEETVRSASGNAKDQAEVWGAEILSKVDAMGNFDRAAFSSVRARLNKAAAAAAKNSNHELATTLGNLVEGMDEMVTASIKDPDVMTALTELRTKYRVAKTLQDTNVVDATGQINPRSFRNAYKRHTPSYKNQRRAMTDYERLLETVDVLTTKPIGTSGTAERLLANRLPGAGVLGYVGMQ